MENTNQNTNDKNSQTINQNHRKEEKQRKNKRKTAIINAVVFTIVVVALGFVIKSYLNVGGGDYTNVAQVESFINPINTRVSAYIKEIRFVEHQPVKKGDTLIILDDREIRTQLDQAEAAYMAALAGKNVVENTIKTASNNIQTVQNNADAAKANIEAAKARLWNVEQNYRRFENLLKEEAVSQQQFDQIKAEYDAAKAQVATLISQYNSVVNSKASSVLGVNEVKSRLAANDADIKRAENALEMAKLNLSYTVITAPHDGIMGRRTVNDRTVAQSKSASGNNCR